MKSSFGYAGGILQRLGTLIKTSGFKKFVCSPRLMVYEGTVQFLEVETYKM